MAKDAPQELDPRENPSPWGCLSEPPPEEVVKILKESAEIASCFHTDWRPRLNSLRGPTTRPY